MLASLDFWGQIQLLWPVVSLILFRCTDYILTSPDREERLMMRQRGAGYAGSLPL